MLTATLQQIQELKDDARIDYLRAYKNWFSCLTQAATRWYIVQEVVRDSGVISSIHTERYLKDEFIKVWSKEPNIENFQNVEKELE